MIRRFKSYRGRGDISGVPLVSNVGTVKMIAIEPNVEQTLPWLDPSNEDDRILASFVEVMREHVRTAVILVTATSIFRTRSSTRDSLSSNRLTGPRRLTSGLTAWLVRLAHPTRLVV